MMITENDSFTTLLLLALRPSPIHGTQPLAANVIYSPVFYGLDVQFSSALPCIINTITHTMLKGN